MKSKDENQASVWLSDWVKTKSESIKEAESDTNDKDNND